MPDFLLVSGEVTRNLNSNQSSGSNKSGVSAGSYHSPPGWGLSPRKALRDLNQIVLCIPGGRTRPRFYP